ncbi:MULTISPECIES: DUF3310 domain-containing protein [unclassified Moraxella]|uniref:DUF3310 domain-containing protein n=1 Tax=unclassified Moraxella TaxID=2685852 RepID=UPI002B417AA3|nr:MULTISPECIES: DUF3310 domain-containing protein [unclassified Moraxella]
MTRQIKIGDVYLDSNGDGEFVIMQVDSKGFYYLWQDEKGKTHLDGCAKNDLTDDRFSYNIYDEIDYTCNTIDYTCNTIDDTCNTIDDTPSDPVNHPTHYTSHPSGVECITITRHHNFAIGNALKYLWRAGLKDGNSDIQDLQKAIWYIQDEIKRLEKGND